MGSELSKEQVAELKNSLEERRSRLLEQTREELLKSDDEDYIELAGRVHDAGEQSVADLLVDLNLASIDRHIQEISAIETTLVNMVTGTFGICVDCDAPIGFNRLEAYPTATRCIRCQASHEMTHAHEGHPSV